MKLPKLPNFALAAIILIASMPVSRATATEFNVNNRRVAAIRQINSYLSSFAIGNQGSSRVNSITLNSDTLQIKGRATIIAKHSWGSIRIPSGAPRCRAFPFRCEQPTKKVDIAAQKTIPFTFKYNLQTGDIAARGSLGRIRLNGGSFLGRRYAIDFGEIKIDLNRIERAIDGDLVAIVESIPNPSAFSRLYRKDHRNEYDRIKQSYINRYGAGNVYFASRKFTEWASADTLARYLGQSFFSSGTASASLMRQISSQSTKEGMAIINWLEKKGVSNARNIAANILSGRRLEYPFLAVKWQTVGYFNRVRIANRPVSLWVKSTHGSFAIVWRNSSSQTIQYSTPIQTGITSEILHDTSLHRATNWLVYKR